LFNGILNIPPERLYAAHMIYQFMIVSTVITIIAVPYDAAITAHENMGYYGKSYLFMSCLYERRGEGPSKMDLKKRIASLRQYILLN